MTDHGATIARAGCSQRPRKEITMDGPMRTLGALLVAAAVTLSVSACGDDAPAPATPTATPPASAEAVAAVESPHAFGPCLPKLNATNRQYTVVDVNGKKVPHVTYDVPGGKLDFVVGWTELDPVPSPMSADEWTATTVDAAGC